MQIVTTQRKSQKDQQVVPYSPWVWIWACPRWRPGGRSCRRPPRCCWRWRLSLGRQCRRSQSKPRASLRYSASYRGIKMKCKGHKSRCGQNVWAASCKKNKYICCPHPMKQTGNARKDQQRKRSTLWKLRSFCVSERTAPFVQLITKYNISIVLIGCMS